MIEGLNRVELKILDPFSEHRRDYIWLRFQACYPDLYRNIKDILPTELTNIFIVSCTLDGGSEPVRMFMFDYDSGDIVGILGTQKMYSTIFDIYANLPLLFYFVDDEGHPKTLTDEETKSEMERNTIGKLILQIMNTIYDHIAKEVAQPILNGDESN